LRGLRSGIVGRMSIILSADLTLDVPAHVLGEAEAPIGVATRYDTTVPGQTIVVTFKVGGARKVGATAAGGTGAPGENVVPSSGTFTLDIATEARGLGWKPGHAVIVTPDPTKSTLVLS
jgi:hypothetical protein